MEGRKEGWTCFTYDYGVRQMINDQSDSKRGLLLQPIYWLLFMISSKGSLIPTVPHWSEM